MRDSAVRPEKLGEQFDYGKAEYHQRGAHGKYSPDVDYGIRIEHRVGKAHGKNRAGRAHQKNPLLAGEQVKEKRENAG